MCGFAGFIDFDGKLDKADLQRMTDRLRHRGPDGQGLYLSQQHGYQIGLGHRRLAILDTSEAGSQPMHFEHLSLIWNGEIYNFQEIQAELIQAGYQFQSRSDSEVILKAFHQWGIDCVERFIGMFAIVLWDQQRHQLWMIRDRLGVKPFYWSQRDGVMAFASELRSILTLPLERPAIDQTAIAQFLALGFIGQPRSIYEGIHKLETGSWLMVDLLSKKITQQKYWSLEAQFQKPKSTLRYEESIEQLDALVRSSCQYRSISDVPLGLFLSGGYDSSTVTAITQRVTNQQMKTFTIGFPDGVNEAPRAAALARYLETDHHSFDCSIEDAKAIVPTIYEYYDEPHSDISCIPSMLLSRLTRQQVTVAMSADGGDELFGGYSGYQNMDALLSRLQPWPTWLQIIGGFGLQTIRGLLSTRHAYRAEALAAVLSAESSQKAALYASYKSQMPPALIRSLLPKLALWKAYQMPSPSDLSEPRDALSIWDFTHPLPDQLLVKMDRASMAYGLEVREPLLDHRLVAFAAELPFSYKVDAHQGKKIWKDLAHRYIPQPLLDQPKTGFDLPLFKWLRGDLSYLMDQYLSPESIRQAGIFHGPSVQRLRQDFEAGRLAYPNLLWRVLSIQMWWAKSIGD